MLLGFASCSDDHYDIRPAEESAAYTLWQNIEANPQLDSLAMILKRVKVYRKETDNNAAQNYAELLNQPQTFTLWAPLNGTYNAKAVLDQLDQVDAMRAEGNREAANKLEYTIGQQFVQNHLARFNYESNRGQQEVRLLNSKLVYYNAAGNLFNGVNLNSHYAAIPCSNGNMHIIDGRSPFAYNVYDFFKAYSDSYSNVYGTISDPSVDKDTFSPELSIEGALNENGEMVYVDSVYTNSNDLLDASRAQIKNEDSLYVAIVPTDRCWDQAMQKVGSLYKYGRNYRTKYNKESADVFSQNYTLDRDSLQDYNTKMALISGMFISPGYFNEEISRSDSAGIVNYVMNSDSLLTTNGLYFYNPTPGHKNPMLDNVTPVKASNGYVFPLESYTIDPSYFYQTKEEINMTYSDNVGYNSNAVVTGGTAVTLVEGVNRDSTADHIKGEVENNSYRFFQAQGQMILYIPLRNVYSGSYRIKMQLLPNRINTAYKLYDADGNELVDRENNVFRASVRPDENPRTNYVTGGRNVEIKVNQDSIQTVTLFDKVTFDKSYNNLPQGVESFPILRLEFTRSMINNMKYKDMVIGLSIGKVILEPVHE